MTLRRVRLDHPRPLLMSLLNTDQPTRGELLAKAGKTLVIVVGIYFIPFMLILVDELVLRTYIAAKLLPQSAKDVFEVVYGPVLQVFGL